MLPVVWNANLTRASLLQTEFINPCQETLECQVLALQNESAAFPLRGVVSSSVWV